MTEVKDGIICLDVRAEDMAQIGKVRHDERLRQLVMRSGLPGAIDVFSDNPKEAADGKLQLVRSFASRNRQ